MPSNNPNPNSQKSPDQTMIAYQVISSFSGRIRLRIPTYLKNPVYQENLQKLVLGITGVTEVRINPLAESLIVSFSPQLTTAELEEKLVDAMTKAAQNKSHQQSKEIIDQLPVQKPEITNTQSFPPEKISLETNEMSLKPLPKSKINQKANLPLLLEELSPTQAYFSVELPKLNYPVESPILSEDNPWLLKCQEQAELIEKLTDKIAQLNTLAGIGLAYLRKWHSYHPETIDFYQTYGKLTDNIPKEKPEIEADWQQLAQQQTQVIAHLQEKIADSQRFANIGEFRLNKWRRFSY